MSLETGGSSGDDNNRNGGEVGGGGETGSGGESGKGGETGFTGDVSGTAETDGETGSIIETGGGTSEIEPAHSEGLFDGMDIEGTRQEPEVHYEINPECKEKLEPTETEELKEGVRPVYENGIEIAKEDPVLDAYKEHNDIDEGHIEKVREQAGSTADGLEKTFTEDTHEGLYSPNIDRKAVECMAIYHDTGMDHNMTPEQYREARETAKDPEELKALDESVRKEHSLESAIHVLQDREKIEAHDIDADKVALGCYMHSKSCSGVKELSSEKEWNDAIDNLKSRVDEYNKQNPENQISFSDSFLRPQEGTESKPGDFDQEKLAEMRSESLCLRIADANGHDCESHMTQSGKEISIDLGAYDPEAAAKSSELQAATENADYKDGFRLEVQDAKVTLDGKELVSENPDDPDAQKAVDISKAYALGEGNFAEATFAENADGKACEQITLVDANAYPLSTQKCIAERCGELATATDEKGEKIDIGVEIHLNGATEETLTSYGAFADQIWEQYGQTVTLYNDGEKLNVTEEREDNGENR